jgi:hypothetical protein
MNIEWNPPKPRQGLLGEWDKFVGPGQTSLEFWLILIASLIAGLAAPLYALRTGLGWTAVQLTVAALIALDLAGGVVTNATSTAKRWYHRSGQGWLQHMQFVAVHALHLILVAWLFRDGDWLYFCIFYAYLLAASLVITRVRLYLQRPMALLLLVGALLLDIYALPPTAGMQWFVPVFFLKLLVSHLLKEAPYPADSTGG